MDPRIIQVVCYTQGHGVWARLRVACVQTSTFHRCSQYIGVKQSMFEKHTVGTSCSRSISALHCRYCECSKYFEVLYYLLRILPCSQYFGFPTCTPVDTPCVSSISGFCIVGVASTGSISSIGSVRTASTRSTNKL